MKKYKIIGYIFLIIFLILVISFVTYRVISANTDNNKNKIKEKAEQLTEAIKEKSEGISEGIKEKSAVISEGIKTVSAETKDRLSETLSRNDSSDVADTDLFDNSHRNITDKKN